jgi:hypothetical protein
MCIFMYIKSLEVEKKLIIRIFNFHHFYLTRSNIMKYNGKNFFLFSLSFK